MRQGRRQRREYLKEMAWVLLLLNAIAVSFGWLIGRRVGLEGEVRWLVLIGCAAVTASILAAMFADAVLGLAAWVFRRLRKPDQATSHREPPA